MRPFPFRLLLFFWAATLISAAVHAYPIEIISEAEATVTLDGKTPSGTRFISLPYLWDGIPHQPDGSVHFKLRLGSIDPARLGPRAIYFARIGNRFEVRLNGTLVSLPLNEQSPRVDLAKAPRLVVIPQSLLHGYDQLEIVILTQGLRRGGLSPIRFGMASDLTREFGKMYTSRITASLAVGCVSVVLGILAMLMWMQQRNPLFLLFGLAELAWAFRVSDVLIDEPPLGWPMWGVLVALAYALYVGLTARLSMLVLGIERGWFRIALRLYLLGACVASVGTYALGYQILWTAWLGLMVGAAMLCAMIASGVALRSRKAEHLLLAFALLASVAVGVRDWVYVWLVPEAFGAASWSRYVSVLFSLTLGWIIASRYARATRDLGLLNRTLADRIAERELQLVVSFDRTREAVQHAAALSERQRLMRDMHDGLGSRLTGAISILRNSEAPNPAVLEYLGEALEELKLTVDSLADVGVDLAPVLGNLRYRLQDRLKAAGVSLIWDVQALPPIQGLTPTNVRSIQNLVLEAMTNAIRHGAATEIMLATSIDADGSHVMILIRDNGRGFDSTQPRLGLGLTLLKQRARELGGEAKIDSHPGGGCKVQVRLPNVLPDPRGGSIA